MGKKVCLQQEICKEFEIHGLCDLYLGVMTVSIYNTCYIVHSVVKKNSNAHGAMNRTLDSVCIYLYVYLYIYT